MKSEVTLNYKKIFKNEISSCEEDCFWVTEYILLEKKKKKVAFCFWMFPLSFGEQAKTHAHVGLAHWKCADASWSCDKDWMWHPSHFQGLFLLKNVFRTSCKAF